MRQGDSHTDPVTGATLRFLETGASSGGARAAMELAVPSGWSAGPAHAHPRQTERMRIVRGRFRARVDGSERDCTPGDEVAVPPGAVHTIRSVGGAGVLEASFEPALRTDELFATMFGADPARRPPAFVPSALRAWVESRGFGDEIRYVWPRRTAVLAVLGGIVALALRRGR